MNKILVATVILLNEDNKFLMEKHKITNKISDLWQFPGGKLETGELLSEAAIRELKEELNIIISANDLIPLSFVDYIRKNRHYIIFYFLCKKWIGSICNQENQVLKWFSLDEANNVNIISYNQQALKQISEILKNN